MLDICQAAQSKHETILRGQTHQLQSVQDSHQICQNLVFPLLTALCACECIQLPVCQMPQCSLFLWRLWLFVVLTCRTLVAAQCSNESQKPWRVSTNACYCAGFQEP